MSERFVVIGRLTNTPGDIDLPDEILGPRALATIDAETLDAADKIRREGGYAWTDKVVPISTLTAAEAFWLGYQEGFDEGLCTG